MDQPCGNAYWKGKYVRGYADKARLAWTCFQTTNTQAGRAAKASNVCVVLALVALVQAHGDPGNAKQGADWENGIEKLWSVAFYGDAVVYGFQTGHGADQAANAGDNKTGAETVHAEVLNDQSR